MATLSLVATAFIFSFPWVSVASFVLAALVSLGSTTQPDPLGLGSVIPLELWSAIPFVLAVLSYYSYLQNHWEGEREAARRAEEAERHAELMAAIRGEE
jgi:hypothetical protein